MRRLFLAPLACVSLALPSRAAQVLTVGPPGSGAQFEVVQDAIDAAAPGDVVLVFAGTYPPFVLDKPVHVQGQGPGQTFITTDVGGVGFLTIATVERVPAGEVAVIAGLSSHIGGLPFSANGLVDVQPQHGTVVLHDLDLSTYAGEACVFASDAGRLVLSSSSLHGGGAAGIGKKNTLQVGGTRLWAAGSTITAPDLFSFFMPPPNVTVGLTDAQARFAGCTFLGASADPSYLADGGVGIRSARSQFFVDRCVVGGGACMTGSGGFAMELLDNSIAVAHADSVVSAGAGGGGVPVSVDATSQYIADPAVSPTIGASAERVTAGDVFQLDLHGTPGATAALFVSLNPGAGIAVPGVVGEVFIDPSAPIALGTFVLDGAGAASVPLVTPMVTVPSLATFQWVEVAAPLSASNAAFVSVL